MRVLVEVDTGHSGTDMTWRDTVDSNVVRSPFSSQVSGHLKYGRLGGVVGDPMVVSVDNGSRHRGNENDGAVNVGLSVHLSSSSSGSEEDSSGVDVEYLLEGLDGVLEGVVGLQDTSGGYTNVHSSRILDNGLHDLVELNIVGDGTLDVLEAAERKAVSNTLVRPSILPDLRSQICYSLPVHDSAVLRDDLEFLGRIRRNVNGVHIGTSLYISQGHFKTKTSVTT